jgi:hypothetical protein
LALVLLVVAGYLSFFKNKKTVELSSGKEKGFLSSFLEKNQNDKDNDGLKDWEEYLWKTDPDNPDTDGDGTLDGEEVRAGRDPLKAGSDDRIENKFSAFTDSSKNNFSDSESSLTDNFSKQFFAEYLKLREEGGIDEADKEKLINSFMESVQNEPIGGHETYKISDIKIIDDNSVAAVKQYGNQVGKVLDNFKNLTGNEMDILRAAMEENRPEELNKLNLFASAYRKSADDFLKIQCPSSFSQTHLDLLNSFLAVEYAVIQSKKIFDDPIRAIQGIKLYFDQGKKNMEIFSKMGVEFEKKKVYFGSDEPGSNLSQYF